MSININQVLPEYGIALNEEEMLYFLQHVKYSEELFPYIGFNKFEEIKKSFIDENEQDDIDVFLDNMSKALSDSEMVYCRSQFSLYTYRDDIYFTAINGECDAEHRYFSLFLLCENRIDYKELCFGYANQYEMIKELKEKYSYALPQEFDFKSHLGYVQGCYED